MAYKIDVLTDLGRTTISFQGRLDASALHDLKTHSEPNLRHRGEVTILIRTGSEIDPAVLNDLAAINGVTLSAESPYLVRWLKQRQKPLRDRGPGNFDDSK